MIRSARRCATACALTAWWSCGVAASVQAQVAHATPAPLKPDSAQVNANTAAPRDVLVVASGEPETLAALHDLLGGLLQQHAVQLHWSTARHIRPRDILAEHSAASELLARIWLDLRDPKQASVYLVDNRQERFLVRVLPLNAGYDEVGRESLGNIIASAVDALVSGAQFGLTRAQATEQVQAVEQAAPAPPAEPEAVAAAQTPPAPQQSLTPPNKGRPPPTRWRGALQGQYRMQLWELGKLFTHHLQVQTQLDRVRGRSVQPHFGALLGYGLPARWTSSGVGARFESVNAAALFGLQHPFAATWTWRVSTKLGATWLDVQPEAAASSDGTPRPAFSVLQPTLGVVAALEAKLGLGVYGVVALGADQDLRGHHFDLQQAARRVALLSAEVPMLHTSVGLSWRP